jgi:hypothetical protein
MTNREFDQLAFDGSNFPTWVLDLKVSLSLRGLYSAISPPQEGVAPLTDNFKYNALFIIWNHIEIWMDVVPYAL